MTNFLQILLALRQRLTNRPLSGSFYRLLLLAVAGALAGAGLWWLTVAGTAAPGRSDRAAGRQAAADIRRALGTVATDTPKATAALAAGRAHLDSARAHARRAIFHHQQATSTHVPPHYSAPPTADSVAARAAAGQLRRQLAGH